MFKTNFFNEKKTTNSRTSFFLIVKKMLLQSTHIHPQNLFPQQFVFTNTNIVTKIYIFTKKTVSQKKEKKLN